MPNFPSKVCFLTSAHPANDTRIFHKEADSLVRDGYDVTLIAQHDKDEIIEGIKIIALPRREDRLKRMVGSTLKVLQFALKQKADVYHFHDPELLPVGVLLKLFTKAKVVYDVHENVKWAILNKFWLPLVVRKPVSVIYQLLEKICFSFIDAIIIAEDSYIENYKGYINKVWPIRNFPKLAYLTTTNKTNKSQNKEENSNITYVGVVSELRGVFEIIEGMRILKESGLKKAMLNLVGQVWPASLKKEIDQLVFKYGLEGYVYLSGRVPYEQVYKILLKTQIGLCLLHPDPNYVESLPTKLFEYMSTGIPVIASDFPLWRMIIDTAGCGLLVDPQDPKAIAEAIEYLLNHPKESTEMGNRGYQTVFKKFNWPREEPKLLQLYEELMGRRQE